MKSVKLDDHISIHTYEDLKNIKDNEWNNCVDKNNIFLSYEFLRLLEDSKSVGHETGWTPLYILIKEDNRVLACIPSYLKNHSQGEYIFDHSWADAFSRIGGEYYPKLLVACPFTPVTGCRFLIHPKANKNIKDIILTSLINITDQLNLSSLHINFCTEDEINFLKKKNLLIRYGEQFHFLNKEYKSFDHFLSTLSSRKRKKIVKERSVLKESGVSTEIVSGNLINNETIEHLYNFYIDTTRKKWGYDYLSKDFFLKLPIFMKNKIIIILAKKGNLIIGAALNFLSNNVLYGRYWGCSENIPFLHFEVCYYKAIELAIKLNLKKVEAGAQGSHKIQRGYLPITTYSAHYIRDTYLRKAVSNFLDQERQAIKEDINIINDRYSPYKKK